MDPARDYTVKSTRSTIRMERQTVKSYGFGWRHLQLFLVFCAVSMSYCLRSNLSICIVEMTNANATEFPSAAVRFEQ
ncbi:Putative inorganic phosphate cotransporter [Frankliniella fusca]|uniref:Inorganic phosphate cotransporter n=1 Tax=Frankliniella fusca TaxID=407009 RepID=A0AAE1HQB4_9NEOP|nr:Putative inorganic phosphate cotransporter [Frankliniella fusca]